MPVQSFAPRASLIPAVRGPEKAVTQTRSTAPESRSSRMSGAAALSRLGSMLIRMSGQVESSSAINGMGSVPAIRAFLTSA